MAVFPNQSPALRSRAFGGMPPPEALRRMEAPPMEAPRPLFSPQQQPQQPQQPQQMQQPHPSQFGGPLVPERMTPEQQQMEENILRLREWQRLSREDPQAADDFVFDEHKPDPRGARKRRIKKKLSRGVISKKLKKFDKRISAAHKRVSEISRFLNEATGSGFRGASGVSGADLYQNVPPPRLPQPPPPPQPPPIAGGGFSRVPLNEQGRSMGQLPNMGDPRNIPQNFQQRSNFMRGGQDFMRGGY